MTGEEGLIFATAKIEKALKKANKTRGVNLAGLKLKVIPDNLLKLNHITDLDLSDNKFNTFPIDLLELKNLKWLNLSDNNIAIIPEEIKRLTRLSQLLLENNNIASLPKELCQLQLLSRLRLGGNKFLHFPEEILSLKGLIGLGLENNEIKSIPKEVVKLKYLQTFNVHGNNIDNIPIEIIKQGRKGIFNYYQSLELSDEIDYLYEAKLVIVGKGFVGKTSLMKKLTIPNYELEEKQETTEGIDIFEWDLDINLKRSNKFRFNLWDFAGQEKYDATHQFFLTERSLYLFVTTARQETNYLDFDYWLNIIRLRTKNSPVIVVQNKIDERDKELPSKMYKQEFPEIIEFAKVSCANGYERKIENLKEIIREAIHYLPQTGDVLPKAWVDVRREIEEIDKRGKDFISYKEYVDICQRFNLTLEQANLLSQYYNDLGVIVHHHDDPKLKEIVVINPDWAVDGVYSVLDSEIVQNKKGKFTLKDLDSIWSAKEYEYKRPELLQLMRKYELCFEVKENIFITPHLLPADSPDNLPSFGLNCLRFVYHYTFMPSGLLSRIIVRINERIRNELFWRYGVVVEFEGSIGQIIEDYSEKEIEIKIKGNNKRELLAIIREKIDSIHSGFSNLEVSEMVPCNCSVCKFSKDPHFFIFGVLKRYENNIISYIRCEDSLEEISVASLIKAAILPGESENYRLLKLEERFNKHINSGSMTKQKNNNPGTTIFTYLIAITIIIPLIYFGYYITNSVWVLMPMIILCWIILVSIITFQQRNDGVMKEEEFLKTFKIVAKKVPPMSLFYNKDK